MLKPTTTNGDYATLNHLGDFTTTTRVLPIAGLAVVIGVAAAYVAAGLLKLISFFTNLFFFQRFSTAQVSPAAHHLGPFVILVPVAGYLGRRRDPAMEGTVATSG